MHATRLHPFSTVTIQENGDVTYNHGGAPLQTTPDTMRHAFPSHHTMTVTPSDFALGDPSGYVDDSWSYAQTDGERISHSMGNAGFFRTVQPEGTDSSGSPNPNRLCNDESTMKCVNDVDYTPAPTNSTSSTVFPDHTDASRSWTGIEPLYCPSPLPGALRRGEVQSTFLTSSYNETQSVSIGSLKPPDKYLVDGIYSSASQRQSITDLRPSWDGELHPTPYGGRNDCSEPSGESSAGPIVTPQGLASPPNKSPLGSSAKPSPSSFPPHCPWGGIFLSDGRKYSCMYALNGQSESQILEHWAREHVANEIFAFRARVITEWDQACFLNTPQKLWTALSHLGICPNKPCVGEIYKATRRIVRGSYGYPTGSDIATSKIHFIFNRQTLTILISLSLSLGRYIYLSDGNKYRCMYTLDSQSDTQILEHWAREHVANEIFAFRARVITEWDQACFLNTPQKLWNAISNLGICPNEPCVGEVFKAIGDREEMIHRHLLNHPECGAVFIVSNAAFTVPPQRAYMDMAVQLGYGDPR
ncbi:hypothetical protein BU17DRAFT_87622 [Hysterangium stoloniferum]|nr:hypothetical protein BU17DRAFT_87622 [Hysterangium stoloniferum]